jgi:hypothetical protein
MRCMVCGAEMRVMQVVPDDTMMVPGYEHHTLQCTGCNDVEQRLVFSRERAWQAAQADAAPTTAPDIEQAADVPQDFAPEPTDEVAVERAEPPVTVPSAPPSAWKRAVAKFLGRQVNSGG